MHRFNIQPEKMETIKATRFETNWKPTLKTHIASNVDKVIENIQNDKPNVKVFTDGSGMAGKIGVAAILYRNGRIKNKIHYQLSSQQHHTVYEGEGIGAILGIKLLQKEWGIRSAIIYIDSQAVITATQLTKPATGHHIFDALHEHIAKLHKKHLGLRISVRGLAETPLVCTYLYQGLPDI